MTAVFQGRVECAVEHAARGIRRHAKVSEARHGRLSCTRRSRRHRRRNRVGRWSKPRGPQPPRDRSSRSAPARRSEVGNEIECLSSTEVVKIGRFCLRRDATPSSDCFAWTGYFLSDPRTARGRVTAQCRRPSRASAAPASTECPRAREGPRRRAPRRAVRRAWRRRDEHEQRLLRRCVSGRRAHAPTLGHCEHAAAGARAASCSLVGPLSVTSQFSRQLSGASA